MILQERIKELEEENKKLNKQIQVLCKKLDEAGICSNYEIDDCITKHSSCIDCWKMWSEKMARKED